MDAILFMILALVLVLKDYRQEVPVTYETIAEDTESGERITKLNDMFYEDDDAFSEIIHALGFPRSDT